jgi:hypothetical protein
VLGVADDEDVLRLREDPGKIADSRWEEVSWRQPPDEAAPCWWITNKDELEKPPRFLSRSLACLRLELQHARVATPE